MADYLLGDAYQDEKRDQVLGDLGDNRWTRNTNDYISYVRSLTSRWPHLQLLVDFMEVGTIPTRWCKFPEENKWRNQSPRYTYPSEAIERESEQETRSCRVNAALLQYKIGEDISIERFDSQKIGCTALANLKKFANDIKEATGNYHFSLFVVEDLSRDVIETLGSVFGIDPRFFRSHITEYVWNNVRDRWRDPSLLEVDAQRRDWFQMRVMRSRYFSTPEELKQAEKEINQFNVMRRIIADNNDIFWDKDPKLSRGLWPSDSDCSTKPVDAKIGLLRSRATFWLSPDSRVGVLLLDPTPEAGYPLWRGYGNWNDIPPFENHSNGYPRPDEPDQEIPPSLQRKATNNKETWFEEYLYWAQRSVNVVNPPESPGGKLQSVPIQSLLHIVCGEWLTFADYLNTRLNQIDWAIARPSFFPEADKDTRKESLDKLHFWRRSVPQARDMLQNCIRQTFRFTKLPNMAEITEPYKYDYTTILERLEEYESRIDRLSSAVTSAISLDDARSTSNLTLLACIFIPPGLVAALMSMTTDPLTELLPAVKWWAIVSATAVAVISGVLLRLNSTVDWYEKAKLVMPIPTLSSLKSGIDNTRQWKMKDMV